MEEDEEAYYIVEEYVEGESLEALMLQSSFITLHFICQTIIEVASILDYMHQLEPNPMIYQDLKSEHIIFGKDGIKLIDFGIASYLGEKGNKYQNYGTPEYCAPEKIREAKISIQTDVYSLGKLLEELIIAEGCKESQCLMQIAKKATSADLTERYANMKSFQKDVEHCMHSKKNPIYQKHLLKKVIITGSQPHIGTTHLSIALTDYLNQQNRFAVYTERNAACDIRKIVGKGHFKEKNGLYEMGTVLAIPAYGAGVEVKIPQSAVEIMDFGTDIEGAMSEEAELFLLLIGSRDWEMEYANLAYEKVHQRKGLAIIANYGNRQQAKLYAKRFQRTVYCFPLDANPFRMTKEKEQLFRGLLEKEGGESERTKCQNHRNCRKHSWQRSNTLIHSISQLCGKWCR